MTEAILRVRNDRGELVWRSFSRPIAEARALRRDEVEPLLQEAERLAEDGAAVVLFLAYEAASAFDPRLPTHPPSRIPLAAFAAFQDWTDAATLPSLTKPLAGCTWTPEWGREEYEQNVSRVRAYIATGDTYQANLSFRLRSEADTDPFDLFRSLARCPFSEYSAYLDLGSHVLCCASPEMFFELDGDRIRCKPMKGTARRGRDLREDVLLSQQLGASEKNQAENLMIVDMVRNDLGRIAEVGSVETSEIFRVDSFATVHQMTSTVEAKTHSSLVEIFRALFPPASITGAPKKRTMEIIRELESSPRGAYTGCIGTVGPGRQARFNVAIRTAVHDRAKADWEYGIGSGVVWDSKAEDEYAECLAKARILEPEAEFELLETILWSPREGVRLVDEHLSRMEASARLLAFRFSRTDALRELHNVKRGAEALVVRLMCARDGAIRTEVRPYVPWPTDRPLRLGVASERVDPEDLTLFHKTTRRDRYRRALEEHPDCDEVLLVNRRGFVTEGAFSNVAVKVGERWVTPRLSHGLLPGVERRVLLEAGKIVEGDLTLDQLDEAEILAFNSVRGTAVGRLAHAGARVGAG